MATDLEQLSVTLSAKIDDFKRGMQDAVRGFDQGASQIEQRNLQLTQSMERNMRQSAASITFISYAFKSLLSVYAFEQFIDAIKRSADAIATLKRQADDARISTQNLAGLHLAGLEQGASTKEIDAALQNFTAQSRKTEEDARGLYKSLELVDPALRKAFASAPTQSERLNIIARALIAAKDETQKYQVAQNALGTTNDRVIAAVTSSAGNLDTLGARARAAGIDIDEGLAAKADEASKKLAVMAEVTSDKLKVALSELAPFLVTTLQEFNALVKSIEAGASAVGQLYQQGLKLLNLDKGGDHAAVGGVYDPDAQRTVYPGEPGYDALSRQTGSGIYTDRMPLRRPAGTGGSGGLPAYTGLENLNKKDAAEKDDELDREEKRIQKQINALNGQAAALGKVGEAAGTAEARERLFTAAQEAGRDITPALRAEIEKLAESYGKIKSALEAAKLEQDVAFERSQVFRTPDEQAIASRTRRLAADDADRLAGSLREVQNLTEGKETATSFVKGLISDLENGVRAGKALENQLKRILEKLADKGIDKLISSAFGGIGGIFGGGGYGAADYGAAATAAAPGAYGPGFAAGGLVGRDGTPTWIPAAALRGAKQFQIGGGVPAILHAGEIVLNQAQQKNVASSMSSGPRGPINLTHAPVINGTGLSKDEVFSVIQRSQKEFARQIGPIFSNWQRRFA